MAKTRAQKEADVARLSELLSASKLAVLTDYRGLDVPSINQLRSELRQAGITYLVTKNTLVRRAIKEAPQKETDTSVFGGPMAIAFGSDEVDAAKIVYDFAKQNEALEIIGAITDEGNLLTRAEVVALAKLPTREQLTGQLVGTIAAPLSGLVRVMNGNVTGLVYALNAIGEIKSAS